MNLVDRCVVGFFLFCILLFLFLTYFDIMWSWEEFISVHVFQVAGFLFIVLLLWQLGAWRWDWLVSGVDRFMCHREKTVSTVSSNKKEADIPFWPADTSNESFLRETGRIVRAREP